MQIQISWLLQKQTDLDLHCLLRQGMLCSAIEGLGTPFQSNDCLCSDKLFGKIRSKHQNVMDGYTDGQTDVKTVPHPHIVPARICGQRGAGKGIFCAVIQECI